MWGYSALDLKKIIIIIVWVCAKFEENVSKNSWDMALTMCKAKTK